MCSSSFPKEPKVTVIHPDVARTRARVASLTRSRTADDVDLAQARRDLTAATAAAGIERILATAPPLTDEQRARLAGLLTGGASS